MKRIALGILLCTLLGTAQAANLTINNGSPIAFSGYDGDPETVTGPRTNGSFGFLSADSAGTFSATYLGEESGFVNSFLLSGALFSLSESNNPGDTISALVGSGPVDFSFSDDQGFTFANTDIQADPLGFAILRGASNSFGPFDFILGFNDSAGGAPDYDDFVVGVNFVPTPIPEPETYAMMLAGLGLIGFMARRRRNKG